MSNIKISLQEECQQVLQSGLKDKITERLSVIFGEKYRIRRVNDIHRQLKILDAFCLFCSLVGALFAVIAAENNLKFEGDTKNISDLTVLKTVFDVDQPIVKGLRALVSILTIFPIAGIVFHYKILLKMNKLRMNLRPEETLFSSGYYKYMIAELLLSAVHTPPGVDGYVGVSQRDPTKADTMVNIDFILLIVLLFSRSYQIIKFIAYHSRYNTYECEKICLESRTPLDFLFCIKASFKENPFTLVGLVLALSIFIFGYSLRSVEMFFMYGGDPSRVQDWRYFWNGMWCMIVTMSTVGFGDFYPISLLGRTIAVIASFWGNFLISLMVAALTVTVEFNPQESISYDSIKTAQAELHYGELGVLLLQNTFRYNWFVKKAENNEGMARSDSFRRHKSTLFSKLKAITEKFRETRKSKYEKIEALLIEMSINRIDDNLNLEMDKIRYQSTILGEIKKMLTEYEANQVHLKKVSLELYRELEEISILKERYLKQL